MQDNLDLPEDDKGMNCKFFTSDDTYIEVDVLSGWSTFLAFVDTTKFKKIEIIIQ